MHFSRLNFVLLNNEKVIGFLSYLTAGKGKYIHLRGLRIAPEFVGRGLARTFQVMTMDFVKRNFPHLVNCSILVWNFSSNSVYNVF